jgi:hypothetical protein
MRKDGARPAVFPVMAASPECLDFAVSHTLDMTNLDSNFRETSSQSYMHPHTGLLPPEQWSSLCPRRGLQPRRETR